jgi:hypothetical protein
MFNLAIDALFVERKSGSAPLERAKCAWLKTVSDWPSMEIKGDPSTILVPIILAVVSALSPITRPPQRAPSPIDEIVEEPEVNVPSTVIVT